MRSAETEILDALRARVAQLASRGDPSSRVYPVASTGSLKDAESALGSRFPGLLARIYTEVANGGFGPADGLLGLTDGYTGVDGLTAVEKYKWLREQGWREHLLPAFDWGDAAWSCVDLTTPTGLIVTADDAGFTATKFNLETWFAAWLSGTNLHSEIYEIGESTIINPMTHQPMVIKRRERAKGRLMEEID